MGLKFPSRQVRVDRRRDDRGGNIEANLATINTGSGCSCRPFRIDVQLTDQEMIDRSTGHVNLSCQPVNHPIANWCLAFLSVPPRLLASCRTIGHGISQSSNRRIQRLCFDEGGAKVMQTFSLHEDPLVYLSSTTALRAIVDERV